MRRHHFWFLIFLLPTIFSSITMTSVAQPSSPDFDFGEQGCTACTWYVVVDGVMGGQSKAEITTRQNSLLLTGHISLANNGGFASIRTPFGEFDLSEHQQVEIRYRANHQSFALVLANNRRFYHPRFKATLPATDNQWTTTTLQFSEFKKMRFDEVLGGGPNQKELKNIIRLGLISNDKEPGPFQLEIDYLRFQK